MGQNSRGIGKNRNAKEDDGKMISEMLVVLRRAKDILQTEGLRPLVRRGFDFMRRRFFRYGGYYLYKSTLGELDLADLTPKIQGLTFNIICSNEEADELAATTGHDFRRRFVNARKSLDKGAIAFCTFAKGEIVNIGWVALSEEAKKTLDPLLQKVDFSNNEAYLSGGETIPEYRRKGLAEHNFCSRLQFLREKGGTSMRLAMGVSNIAPQKVALRHGAQIYARARYMRILWWKSWKEIPLAQRVHGD